MARPEDLVPLARRAEDVGVSVLTVADHLDDQLAPIAALMAAADGLLSGGVLPVLKHLPGHGRAREDSHHALPVVDAGATFDISGGRATY